MIFKGEIHLVLDFDSQKEAEKFMQEAMWEMTGSLCVDFASWFLKEVTTNE